MKKIIKFILKFFALFSALLGVFYVFRDKISNLNIIHDEEGNMKQPFLCIYTFFDSLCDYIGSIKDKCCNCCEDDFEDDFDDDFEDDWDPDRIKDDKDSREYVSIDITADTEK